MQRGCQSASYILGGLNCPGGWGGGICEMKDIHGVKKMVNHYPLIARRHNV